MLKRVFTSERVIVVAALAAVLSVISLRLSAQSLSASVSRNPVAVGEQFQVTFNLNASGSGFQGPSFPDFFVLSGPNQSSSIQIINGSVSQTLSYTYYLQAKTEGNFKIDAASVICNGKKLESPPFTITVVKGNPKQQGSSQQQGESSESSGLDEKDVFIKISVDKTSVFRGEAITVSFKLCTRVQVLNYSVSKAPSLNGFWSQEIQVPNPPVGKAENINGVMYDAYEIKKTVLFPQQGGSLTIDPMEGECIVRVKTKAQRRSNDPFDIFNDPFFRDPFGFGSVREMKVGIKSEPVKISVRDLPGNAGPGFNGAVGKFSFECKLDKTETNANDPVSLKIKISGRGNLSLINAPKIEFPPEIEAYDPKVTDNFTTGPGGNSGYRSYEFLLIPRHEATYEIPPVEFTYFDLEKKNYVSFNSGKFNLKVGKGTGTYVPAITGTSKAEVQVLGKDIRFIKTTLPVVVTGSQKFTGSALFWVLSLSPLFLFGGLLVFKKQRDKINSDFTSLKKRRATAIARKKLAAARKFLDSSQHEKLFDEVSKTLWSFTGDKLGIAPADLSKERASDALAGKNVSGQTIAELIALIDRCEFARYSSSSDPVDASVVYNDAVRIISKIEEEVKI